MQINASAIIQFKLFLFSDFIAVDVVVVVGRLVFPGVVGLVACLLAGNFSMISKHYPDSLQVLLTIASFHGLEAKQNASMDHTHSPTTTITNPSNQQTLHSEDKTKTR